MEDIKGEFFEGKVRIIENDLVNTMYMILYKGNFAGSISVKNDTHIRMIKDLKYPPLSFKILAPLGAIEVVEGKIPKKVIKIYPASYFIKLGNKYYGP